jgi:hypothetical protein
MSADRPYYILAIRSGASVFGAACAIAKENGVPQFYATREEAEQAQKSMTARIKSANVRYVVRDDG